jgi:hypothetical protein
LFGTISPTYGCSLLVEAISIFASITVSDFLQEVKRIKQILPLFQRLNFSFRLILKDL